MSRLAAGLVALAAIALAVALGNWQLRRADQKLQQQAAHDRAVADGAVEFSAVEVPEEPQVGRILRFRGRFDDARSIFLDNYTHDGIVGFQVLAPLHLAGSGRVVMVLRGWTPADPADRTRLPRVRDSGEAQLLEGVVEAGVPERLRLGNWQPGGSDDRIWPRFGATEYAAWSGLSVYPWVVRQTSASDDGLLRDWPRPDSGVQRHRAVAGMWYSFALLFFCLWLWYGLWAPRRAREPR